MLVLSRKCGEKIVVPEQNITITVLEVRGAEITVSPIHTCAWGALRPGAGLAIRFPRFTGRWRDDKGPEDATTARELVEMYHLQLKQTKKEPARSA